MESKTPEPPMKLRRNNIITVLRQKYSNYAIQSTTNHIYKLDPDNQATTFYPNYEMAFIQLIEFKPNLYQIFNYNP